MEVDGFGLAPKKEEICEKKEDPDMAGVGRC